jgi:hypothetical protein
MHFNEMTKFGLSCGVLRSDCVSSYRDHRGKKLGTVITRRVVDTKSA